MHDSGQVNGIIGGIEGGGTKFVCAVGDTPQKILAKTTIKTETPEKTFAAVNAFFSNCASEFGAIKRIGVGTFGPIDLDKNSSKHGCYLNTPKEHWAGASITQALREQCCKVYVDTDVNCAGVAESQFGNGRDVNRVAYITVGTGIGGAIIQSGRPVSGNNHFEMGHMFIQQDVVRDSFEGSCTFHGACLEGLASGAAIKARWGKSLSEMSAHPERISLIADYLGQMVANIVFCHRPDRVIIGGGVMKTEGVLELIKERARHRLGGYIECGTAVTGWDHFVVRPLLSDDAGVIGAMALT